MLSVNLKTNINRKLDCSAFVHISQAPPAPVPECKLGQIYQIKTDDGSHEPVMAKLLYFNRFNLGSAIDAFTIPSHGMDAVDFINWYMQNNPGTDYGTNLAVYFYQQQMPTND